MDRREYKWINYKRFLLAVTALNACWDAAPRTCRKRKRCIPINKLTKTLEHSCNSKTCKKQWILHQENAHDYSGYLYSEGTFGYILFIIIISKRVSVRKFRSLYSPFCGKAGRNTSRCK